MGLPHTLPGIVGFMIFVGFMISQIYATDPGVTKLENDMRSSMNQSVPDNPVYAPVYVFSLIWDAILLMFGYTSVFLANSTKFPSQFYILFSFIIIVFVIAIVKLIRGVWDY